MRNRARMSREPTLLVVTPTLGTSPYLEETIRGVQALPFSVKHLLAVPQPMVVTLQEKYPGCLVVPDAGKAGGIYGALNKALENAGDDWDWFTYINDDDLLGEDFASVFLKHIRQPDPAPVVYGNVRLIDDKGARLGTITTENNPAYIPALLQQGTSPLNQQGMLFQRECVRKLGGFDLQYKLCADLDFWARALAGGFAFRFYPAELGRFRIREGQLSGNILLTREELTRITAAHFPQTVSPLGKKWAKVRYRWINLPRYLERFRRSGVKTSEEILES